MNRQDVDIPFEQSNEQDHQVHGVFQNLLDALFSKRPNAIKNLQSKFFREKTCSRILEKMAQSYPNEVAALIGNDSIDYKTLRDRVQMLTANLLKIGARSGSTIEMYLRKSTLILIAFLASIDCEAVAVVMEIEDLPEIKSSRGESLDRAEMVLTVADLRHLIPLTKNQICIAIDELTI